MPDQAVPNAPSADSGGKRESVFTSGRGKTPPYLKILPTRVPIAKKSFYPSFAG
jgi:hypothetical protein